MDKADIVFEEPVEGGITRYAAVFQCQDVALVGPVRSARNIDIGILGQLGTPLEVHVGGINPVLANLNASPIVNVDLGNLRSHHDPPGRPSRPRCRLHLDPGRLRHPPHHDHAAAAALHVLEGGPGRRHPGLDRQHQLLGNLERHLEVQPDLPALPALLQRDHPRHPPDGAQNAAANVIVQYVQISYGPWAENQQGGLEVQADLYPNASGTAVVYRNGMAYPATWHRTTLGSPTQYVDATGAVDPDAAGSDLGRVRTQLHPGRHDAVA